MTDFGNPMDKAFRSAIRARNDLDLRHKALELAVEYCRDHPAADIVAVAQRAHKFLCGDEEEFVDHEADCDEYDTDEDHFLYEMGYKKGFEAASILYGEKALGPFKLNWGGA